LEKGSFIVKDGNIGTLDFYLDNTMPVNVFSIYDENRQYDFTFKDTGDIRKYLSDILDEILEERIAPINLEQNLEEDIEFRMDKDLPQSEFVEKHKQMREEMAKMNINPYKNKY
jgi:hypothetical protein